MCTCFELQQQTWGKKNLMMYTASTQRWSMFQHMEEKNAKEQAVTKSWLHYSKSLLIDLFLIYILCLWCKLVWFGPNCRNFFLFKKKAANFCEEKPHVPKNDSPAVHRAIATPSTQFCMREWEPCKSQARLMSSAGKEATQYYALS